MSLNFRVVVVGSVGGKSNKYYIGNIYKYLILRVKVIFHIRKGSMTNKGFRDKLVIEKL